MTVFFFRIQSGQFQFNSTVAKKNRIYRVQSKADGYKVTLSSHWMALRLFNPRVARPPSPRSGSGWPARRSDKNHGQIHIRWIKTGGEHFLLPLFICRCNKSISFRIILIGELQFLVLVLSCSPCPWLTKSADDLLQRMQSSRGINLVTCYEETTLLLFHLRQSL